MPTMDQWTADDHDHGPTAQLLGDAWCLTCQHTHIATIPVTTFRCAGDHHGCGFGCWGVTVAAAHAEQYPGHVVYPQLHQMVPARPTPSEDTAPAETLADGLLSDLVVSAYARRVIAPGLWWLDAGPDDLRVVAALREAREALTELQEILRAVLAEGDPT